MGPGRLEAGGPRRGGGGRLGEPSLPLSAHAGGLCRLRVGSFRRNDRGDQRRGGGDPSIRGGGALLHGGREKGLLGGGFGLWQSIQINPREIRGLPEHLIRGSLSKIKT